jgi:mRNA interferase MazF
MPMQHTISYRRGDVVLVNFVFVNQTGVKRRPAVVISSQTYNLGRLEVVLAAITSNVRRRLLPGDTVVQAWREAGLLAPSVVTGIIRTVRQTALARRLGSLIPENMREVEASLRLSLGL